MLLLDTKESCEMGKPKRWCGRLKGHSGAKEIRCRPMCTPVKGDSRGRTPVCNQVVEIGG